jgi:hypothetical protein
MKTYQDTYHNKGLLLRLVNIILLLQQSHAKDLLMPQPG